MEDGIGELEDWMSDGMVLMTKKPKKRKKEKIILILEQKNVCFLFLTSRKLYVLQGVSNTV